MALSMHSLFNDLQCREEIRQWLTVRTNKDSSFADALLYNHAQERNSPIMSRLVPLTFAKAGSVFQLNDALSDFCLVTLTDYSNDNEDMRSSILP